MRAPGSAPLSSRKCVCYGQAHGPSSVNPGGPTIHQHRPVDGTQAPLCACHTRAPKETLQGREPKAGLTASCRLPSAKWGRSRTSHTGGTRGCGEFRPGTLVLERTNQEGELGKFWQLWPPAPPSVGENKRPAKSPALASEVPLPGPPGLTWKPTHIPPPPVPPHTHTPVPSWPPGTSADKERQRQAVQVRPAEP